MNAGYSGTPLAEKLGIRKGDTLVVLHDPGHFADMVAPLPPAVKVRTSARGKADVAVFFTTARRDLERRIDTLGRLIHPDGGVWVAWPKRAAKLETDMTEDVVRDVVLPLGLVDVKVAAIDETWSGLKVVWRKQYR